MRQRKNGFRVGLRAAVLLFAVSAHAGEREQASTTDTTDTRTTDTTRTPDTAGTTGTTGTTSTTPTTTTTSTTTTTTTTTTREDGIDPREPAPTDARDPKEGHFFPARLRPVWMPEPPTDLDPQKGPPVWRLPEPTDPFDDIPPIAFDPQHPHCGDGVGWSFETGLEGWSPSGPFYRGRVYGNNVHIDRLKPRGYVPNDLSLDDDQSPHDRIGGDYWAFSRDVNQQGNWWIGSSDTRPSPHDDPGQRQPESSRGRLISPEFTIDGGYLRFFIGGGAELGQHVQLEVESYGGDDVFALDESYDGIGVSELPSEAYNLPLTAYVPGMVVVRASTSLESGEFMRRRVAWDLSPYKGRRARIVVVDDLTHKQPLQHVNVDEFVCTAKVDDEVEWLEGGPDPLYPSVGSTMTPIPLWGTTDTHTHPFSNLGFGGFLQWGDPADDLDKVYDCSTVLPQIGDGDPDNGGRPLIDPNVGIQECKFAHDDPAYLSVISFAFDQLCHFAPSEEELVPFFCEGKAAAFIEKLAGQSLLSIEPMHGSPSALAGGLNPNQDIIGMLADQLDDPPIDEHLDVDDHIQGLVDRLGFSKDDGRHDHHGIKTHQFFQKDMVVRAWQGGLRLVGLDVLDSRMITEAVGEEGVVYDEWKTIRRVVEATKRLVAPDGDPTYPPGPLRDIAGIATTPGEARKLIEANKIAIVLGIETDELGVPRFAGDTLTLQIAELHALGIRKITPIHAMNNSLGGAGVFNDVYATGQNELANSVDPDRGAHGDTYPIFDPNQLLGAGALSMMARDRGGNTCPDGAVVGEDGCAWYDKNNGWFDLAVDNPSSWLDPNPEESLTFRFGFASADVLARANNGVNGALYKAFSDGGDTWHPVEEVSRIFGANHLLKGSSMCRIDDRPLPMNAMKIEYEFNGEYTDTVCDPNNCDASNGGCTDMCMSLEGGDVLPHMNNVGLLKEGKDGLRQMMELGLIIDLDHLSEKARVDAWDVSALAGADAGTDEYPFFAVHTDIRGLTSHTPALELERLQHDRGFSAEVDRTAAEFERSREHGGVFSPGMNGSHLRDDKELTTASEGPEPMDGPLVNNDCDFSAKSFALKYLVMRERMGGHGITPSTDMSPFWSPASPRFGQNRCHKKTTFEDNRRRKYDSFDDNEFKVCHPLQGFSAKWDEQDCRPDMFPHDWDADSYVCRIWGKFTPGCPTFELLEAQYQEGAGVEYEDYADRAPWQPDADAVQGNPAVMYVVARNAGESRDDGAPREPVPELVSYGNAHQLAPMKKMKTMAAGVVGNTGWDINLDGFQHIGLLPDFMQDVRNVGVPFEYMTPLFNAAEEYVRLWERDCKVANALAASRGADPVCPDAK